MKIIHYKDLKYSVKRINQALNVEVDTVYYIIQNRKIKEIFKTLKPCLYHSKIRTWDYIKMSKKVFENKYLKIGLGNTPTSKGIPITLIK